MGDLWAGTGSKEEAEKFYKKAEELRRKGY